MSVTSGPSSQIDPGRIHLYNAGRTTVFAYPKDPRFSYCLYVPKKNPDRPAPGLVVTIHHSLRTFALSRDLFADLGERTNQIVLAPLFPANVFGDGNMDGYKYLIEKDIRYDRILNDMIDHVGETTGCDTSRFCLYGFSGGGHFAHRYALVHPERLRAGSIGAPGQVTLLDPDVDWWAGIRDFETHFGHPVDLEALRNVPVHMVIGDKDLDTHQIVHAEGSIYWRAESAAAGANRVERLRTLQASFAQAGIDAEFELVADAAHDYLPVTARAEAFLERQLKTDRA